MWWGLMRTYTLCTLDNPALQASLTATFCQLSVVTYSLPVDTVGLHVAPEMNWRDLPHDRPRGDHCGKVLINCVMAETGNGEQ